MGRARRTGEQRDLQSFPTMLQAALAGVDCHVFGCRSLSEVWPYLEESPKGFVDKADVTLVVEGIRYPAHSQVLASRSDVVYRLLEDCPEYSRQQPLVISEAFADYKRPAIQTFLHHVYNSQPISNHQEAQQLLAMADLLEAPSLMKHAIAYLESTANLLQANCGPEGAIHWLLLADQYDLATFKCQCIKYAALNFGHLRHDARLQELSTATCVLLMQELQQVIEQHTARPWGSLGSSTSTAGTRSGFGFGTTPAFAPPISVGNSGLSEQPPPGPFAASPSGFRSLSFGAAAPSSGRNFGGATFGAAAPSSGHSFGGIPFGAAAASSGSAFGGPTFGAAAPSSQAYVHLGAPQASASSAPEFGSSLVSAQAPKSNSLFA